MSCTSGRAAVTSPSRPTSAPDDSGPTSSSDPFAFMDPRMPRLRYAMGD